jgi:hypothetical protein
MAKQETWLQRIITGQSDRPDFEFYKPEGSRWSAFMTALRSKFLTLIQLNLLTAVFFAPAFVWLYFQLSAKLNLGYIAPFTANLGFGYPMNPAGDYAYRSILRNADVFSASVLCGLLIFAGAGLAGAFSAMRRIIAAPPESKVKGLVWAFLKGVKSGFLPFGLTSAVVGGGVLLLTYTADSYALSDNPAGIIFGIIGAAILLAILVFMAIFIFSQSALGEKNLARLLKNGVYYSAGKALPTLIIA